jgi:hypothetical protein
LFQSTLENSKVDYGEFEQLHPRYFPSVVNGLGTNAQIVLCWHEDELLSFQLALLGRDRLIAKQIGMKYPQARDFNLYFVNWLELIDFAIAKRIPRIEMGATTYATKVLFGGYLERRWLYFRFRNTVLNRITGPIAPLFDFEKSRAAPAGSPLVADNARCPSLADRKRRVIGLGVFAFGTTPGERLLSLGAQIARMAPAQFFSVRPLIDH